jgi:hypothetical protein
MLEEVKLDVILVPSRALEQKTRILCLVALFFSHNQNARKDWKQKCDSRMDPRAEHVASHRQGHASTHFASVSAEAHLITDRFRAPEITALQLAYSSKADYTSHSAHHTSLRETVDQSEAQCSSSVISRPNFSTSTQFDPAQKFEVDK